MAELSTKWLQNRMKKQITRLVFGLVMMGLSGLPLQLRGEPEQTPWEKYVTATERYRQQPDDPALVALCQDVRKHANDKTIFSQASLLLSQLYVNLGEVGKAHAILNALYSDRDTQPAVVQEAKLRDAQLYVSAGPAERARPLFTDVARSEASLFLRQEGRLALAWQLADAQEWQACDSVLAAVVDAQPSYAKDERMSVLRARQFMAKGDPKQAIALLQQAKGISALRYLARAYELAEKPIFAVGVYQKIHDLYPDSPEAEVALFQAGEVFLHNHDWIAAKSELLRFQQYYPQSAYADMVNFRLGWIHYNLGQYEDALTMFGRITGTRTRLQIAFMEAECYRQMGAEDAELLRQAIVTYNNIIALYPNSALAPLAKLRMAMTLLEAGEISDALISLRQFLSLHPKDTLASAATFLLAKHTGEPQRTTYFTDILHNYAGQTVYDAALAALQKQDYDAGNYQRIINRKAHFAIAEDYPAESYYQRVYHFLLAEAAYFLQQYDLAQREYALVVRGQEDELEGQAQLGLAWCALQTGRTDAAVAQFKALQLNSAGRQHIRAAYGLASTYFRLKRFEEALQSYPLRFEDGAGPELYPLMARSYFRVGESYFRLQFYNQAIEMWQHVVSQYPTSGLAPEAQYKIADTFFRANHFDEAKTAYQHILNHFPNSTFAAKSVLGMGQSEYNAERYQEAIKYFQQFLYEYPENEQSKDAMDGMLLCYYQLGDAQKAKEALLKVIEKAPASPLAADARYKIGESYFEAKDYDAAIEAFKEILTLYPGTSYSMDAQFTLALAFAEKGDFHAANNEFARYVQYFPTSSQIPEALYNLAVGYFNVKSYLSAADYFQRIVKEFPDSEYFQPSLQNLGWCYVNLDEHEQALKYFQQYAKAFPKAEDRDKIRLQMAKLSIEAGRSAEAVAVLKKLRTSADRNIATEAAFRLGKTYLTMQKSEAARDAFYLAIRKGERENYYRLSALSQLAALFEAGKQWKKAIKMYRLLIDSTTEQSWADAAQERITLIKSLMTSNSH